MKTKRHIRIGIVVAVVLVFGQSVFAVPLSSDPSAMSAYRGSSSFAVGGVLSGYVDYAVYAPGKYDGSMSFGNLYVYAYQIFDNRSSTASIDYFSVGLDSSASVSAILYDSAAGYTGGSNNIPSLSILMSQQALYLFQYDSISANENSCTLLFTSKIAPGMAEGVVSAGVAGGAVVALPSPVPEPATFGLLIGGAFMAIRRKTKSLR